MNRKKESNAEKRERQYQWRKQNRDAPATLWEASRYLGESMRSLQSRSAEESPKWRVLANRRRYDWTELDSYMPRGATDWPTTSETAALLGKTLRQLELMRAKGVGPSWRVFGKKMVRYELQSVDVYNQAATSTKEGKSKLETENNVEMQK